MSSEDRDLERYFAPLKEADYGDTFEATRMWLARAERRRHDKQAQQPWGARIREYVRGHRVRLALTSLFLALLFAACTIPVAEEEILGYTLSGRFRPESARAVMDEVHGLAWVHEVRWGTIRGAATDQDSQGPIEWLTFVIVLPDAAQGEVERRRRELEAVAAVSSLEVRPMTVEVKRPLYKAAVPSAWRPRGWKASIRLTDTISDANVERAVVEHLEQLQMHDVEVEVVRGADGTRELVLSSPSWASMRDEGLRQIEQLQREVQPHVAEGAGLVFTLSGTFLPSTSNSVLDQIHEKEWLGYIHYGTIREGGAVQWLTFEIPLPGISREEADAYAKELASIEGVSSVEVLMLGQE